MIKSQNKCNFFNSVANLCHFQPKYIISIFSDILASGTKTGTQLALYICEIQIKSKSRDNTQPLGLHVPSKVASPLLAKTKAEIDRILTINVIFRADEPTDWCSPMVVTTSASGEVRICVDVTKLNKSIKRKAHPFHLLILHWVNWMVQRFSLK